jgi:type I restriction enzyme S subunit
MTRKGTIGNCAVYPDNFPLGIMHSDLLRLRVNQQLCESAFLAHQLHYSQAVGQQLELISGGAVMPGINVTKLKHLEVLVPPITIQREFTHRSDSIKKLKRSYKDSLAEYDSLFASLLQRAFRGKL